MHRTARTAIALATCLLLLGCSQGAGAPVRQPEAPIPDTAPVFVPDGSAAENLPVFEYALRSFGAGAQTVEGAPIVEALVSAGFDREAMQVSFDRTQTGLVADSIFVSVRIADECLLGQVVTEDRSVSVLLGEALGPEKSICLLGETRPIDW